MRRLLAVLALTALAACKGDRTTEPSEQLSGSYALKSVNGLALPAVIAQSGEDKYEIVSGTLTITKGSSYNLTINGRSTIAGEVTTEVLQDAGSVAMSGAAVTFTSSTPGETPMAANFSNGNTITAGDQGSSFVFQK
jgi:hypothetical protein